MTAVGDLDVSGALGRLVLRGDIDLLVVPEVQAAVQRAKDQHVTSLEVDLALVDFIDSSGLGVLAQASSEFERLRVVDAPISIVRILEMTGLGDLLLRSDEAG